MDSIKEWFHNLTSTQQTWAIAGGILALIFVPLGVAFAAQQDWNNNPDVIYSPTSEVSVAPSLTPTPSPTPCPIKGNTNFETGEKIYHLPSDPYYGATVIEPGKGERYFCTEAEATAAGWRHANPPPPQYGGPEDHGDECDQYETQEDANNDGADCEDLPSEDEQSGGSDYGDEGDY